MKVVCIYGSPRKKGNSATIANRFLDRLNESHDGVKKYYLNKLNFKGCQGCMSCKGKAEKCVLKDDLTEVLEQIKETDVLVLATPVYYYDITGQMKCFIDRTWSFLKEDWEENPEPSRISSGKTIVFIQTQGDANPEMHKDVYMKYELFFKMYGFTKFHLIRGCDVNELGEAGTKADIMQAADDAAEKIRPTM